MAYKENFYAEKLKEAKAKLARYEKEGDAACSQFDLDYGYNAKFNMKLLRNHIKYCEDKLNEKPTLDRWQ